MTYIKYMAFAFFALVVLMLAQSRADAQTTHKASLQTQAMKNALLTPLDVSLDLEKQYVKILSICQHGTFMRYISTPNAFDAETDAFLYSNMPIGYMLFVGMSSPKPKIRKITGNFLLNLYRPDLATINSAATATKAVLANVITGERGCGFRVRNTVIFQIHMQFFAQHLESLGTEHDKFMAKALWRGSVAQ